MGLENFLPSFILPDEVAWARPFYPAKAITFFWANTQTCCDPENAVRARLIRTNTDEGVV